jgi:hypothetical protein
MTQPLKHERNQASVLYDDEMVEAVIDELKRRGHIETILPLPEPDNFDICPSGKYKGKNGSNCRLGSFKK